MAEDNHEEVLSLTTTQTRKKIKIDGVSYELLDPYEFNFTEYQNYLVMFANIRKILKSEKEVSDEEATKMLARFDPFIQRVVIGIPDNVLHALADLQKMKIVDCIFPTEATEEKDQPSQEQKPSASSPGSRDSMAEAPETG